MSDIYAMSAIALTAAVFALGVWVHFRSRRLVREWAATNGLEIIQLQERPILRGPFFWNSSSGQMVFFTALRDRMGREKSGFVRVGSFFAGVLSRRIDVIWD